MYRYTVYFCRERFIRCKEYFLSCCPWSVSQNLIIFKASATDSVKLFGIVTETERKSLETFMQFEREILFLLEIIKKIDALKKNQVLKKCCKHYLRIVL